MLATKEHKEHKRDCDWLIPSLKLAAIKEKCEVESLPASTAIAFVPELFCPRRHRYINLR